jgi:elongation factor Ts
MMITATMVKELRERTGSGMMECKKALQEANGDIDLAIENMRKAGQAKADKKASRTAAEGIIVVRASDDNKQAVMLEVNCETDFVARDENFLAFVKNAAETALANNTSNTDDLLACTNVTGLTVDEDRKNLIVKIGENINIRRVECLVSKTGHVGSYIHGGRIGVMVELEGGSVALAKDIAMHVTAASPLVVTPEEVSQDLVEKEKEIFSAQARQSGKPVEIIEKMISGRIQKFLDEVSLIGQPFVKDPSTTIGKLLKVENAKVKQFIRFQVGEGIEKKQDNFAEEVMAQVKGSN